MKNNAEREKTLQKIYTFLESLPIPVTFCKINPETFLPGIKIQDGDLLIDNEKLMHPGDILHEAGHIAVSLAEERTHLNDNVIKKITNQKKGKNLPLCYGPTLQQCIWTLSLKLFLYKGESEWILKEYRNQNFIGLPLLQWMGLTYKEIEALSFPKMKKWLRV